MKTPKPVRRAVKARQKFYRKIDKLSDKKVGKKTPGKTKRAYQKVAARSVKYVAKHNAQVSRKGKLKKSSRPGGYGNATLKDYGL